MKFILPQSPQMFFEAGIISNNNKQLSEFKESVVAPNTLQCYVPVVDGNYLDIVCKVSDLPKGSVIDLIVDGVVRDVYQQSKRTSGAAICKFDSGLYKPIEYHLRRGRLTVCAELQQSSSLQSNVSFGTIELHLYRAQSSGQHAARMGMPNFLDGVTSQGLKVPRTTHRVPIDSQIAFSGNHLVTQSNKKTYKRLLNAKRPGIRPWAILRFIYRTAETLRAAKIMNSQAKANKSLVPDLVSIISEEPSINNVSKKSKAEAQMAREADSISDELTENDETASTAAETELAAGLFSISPIKTESEMADLRSDASSWVHRAEETKRQAKEAREKLIAQSRRQRQSGLEYEQLQRRKAKAQARVEKHSRDIEAIQAELNRQQD